MGSSSAEKVSLGNEADRPVTNIEIKIKTLDSQTYTMKVDKQMPVPALKEQIASVTGVLSEQQRLICRGKVLKDDQLLSAYHVEDGHTLHLVVRQPPPLSDPSLSSYPASDPASSTNGGPARLLAPSVVIETFNVPNQEDGVPPEFNRLVSAVLGYLGVHTAGSGGEGMETRAHDLQRHERTSDPTSVSEATLTQPELANMRGQSDRSHNVFGFPTSIHAGSANPPVIQDSVTTLSQYLTHVRREFDAIGRGLEQNNQAAPLQRTAERGPSYASHSQNAVEGLPTPALLGEVMLSTRQMLVEQVGENLLQLARQLENQVNVTDSLLRSSMQTSALRTGVALHNLGAFLLELGRTTMTLRLGETPAEALVNAGPAVFISPTGPNPIMVQPFPFQPGMSFGSIPMGAVQPGSGLVNGLGVQRRIDIQIRRGSPAAMPNVSREDLGDPQQPSERRNPTSNIAGENIINQAAPATNVSRESGVRLVPVRTMVAAVPSHFNRLPSDASVNSLGVYYPVLGRFQQLGSGPVRTEQGSQASSEHHSTGIQAEQQAQNSGAVGDGFSIRQQEATNAPSVNINILAPGGAQNNQESERQIPGSVAQLLRALFPGGEIHVEEAGLQGQATEPNPENGGTSNRASDPLAPEPRTSDEGIFLSNLLHQIMPLISQNAGDEPNAVPLEESSASEHRIAREFSNQAENSDAGTSSRQRDPEVNPPSSKRQKME